MAFKNFPIEAYYMLELHISANELNDLAYRMLTYAFESFICVLA